LNNLLVISWHVQDSIKKWYIRALCYLHVHITLFFCTSIFICHYSISKHRFKYSTDFNVNSVHRHIFAEFLQQRQQSFQNLRFAVLKLQCQRDTLTAAETKTVIFTIKTLPKYQQLYHPDGQYNKIPALIDCSTCIHNALVEVHPPPWISKIHNFWRTTVMSHCGWILHLRTKLHANCGVVAKKIVFCNMASVRHTGWFLSFGDIIFCYSPTAYKISSKLDYISMKFSMKYGDVTIFKMAVICHHEVSKFAICSNRP